MHERRISPSAGFLLAAISLLAMVDPTLADSGEVLRPGSALEAGAVDSSLVGHFQILADSARVASGLQAMPDSQMKKTMIKDTKATGRRVLKVGAGFSLGFISAYALGTYLISQQGGNYFAEYSAAFSGFVAGYTIGTAVGVTLLDPYDRFIITLAGSSVGLGLGIMAYGYELSGEWPLLVCPLVGATVASELWRDVPQERGFSIGLAPNCNGSLLAVAKLRF